MKTNNIKTIKDIVIKKGVRPDIECLRNACQNKTNITTVQFLVDCGITPDLTCLKNLSYYFNQNTTLCYLIDQLIRKNIKDNSSTQYNADDPLSNDKIITVSKYIDINNNKKDKVNNVLSDNSKVEGKKIVIQLSYTNSKIE